MKYELLHKWEIITNGVKTQERIPGDRRVAKFEDILIFLFKQYKYKYVDFLIHIQLRILSFM